jgi:hypothetical protein
MRSDCKNTRKCDVYLHLLLRLMAQIIVSYAYISALAITCASNHLNDEPEPM